jgi:hypothetical protein
MGAEVSKDFFFERKQQKTFADWAQSIRASRSQVGQKFFGSFFQKRTHSLRLNL